MLRLTTRDGIIIIILQHKFEFPGPQNKSRSPGCKQWQFWILVEKAVAQANILVHIAMLKKRNYLMEMEKVEQLVLYNLQLQHIE